MNINLADAILSAVTESGRQHNAVICEVARKVKFDDLHGYGPIYVGIQVLCSCNVLISENDAVYRGLRYEECLAELRDAQAVVEAFSTKYDQ